MKRVFALPIIFLALLILVVYFLLPAYSKLSAMEEKLAKKEETLKEQREYVSRIESILKKLDDYSESVQKVNSALPEETYFSQLLNFFRYRADADGLILTSLSPISLSGPQRERQEEASKSSKIKESLFSLVLSGEFSSYESFIRSIENSSRMIEIENMSLEKESDGESIQITMEVKVHSY